MNNNVFASSCSPAPNWKRVGARCTDIGFNIIFLIVVTLIYNLVAFSQFVLISSASSATQQVVLLFIQFALFIFYFVLIPLRTSGQTMGKKLFGIRLVASNSRRIPFWIYFLRETYILVFPLLISFLIIKIPPSFLGDRSREILAANFLFLWFFFLFLFQKINQDHQLFYDRYFSLIVVSTAVAMASSSAKISQTFRADKSLTSLQSNYLTKLNPQQKLAATTSSKKNVLIIAGPGTGKTTVLVHKIVYLITHERILPWRILVLTFTKKAAQNVRDRINAQIKSTENKYQIFTYHSFCYSFLREEVARISELDDLVVLDETDRKTLIKNLIKETKNYQSEKIDKTTLKNIIWMIDLRARKLKNTKKEFVALFKQYDEFANTADSFIDLVWTVSERYAAHKKQQGLMDFNDLLIVTYDLLAANKNLLAQWQKRFDAVLIDEFQDTSFLQYRLIELLTQNGRKIKTTVIGDPDQTIYGWRDAKIDFILNFCRNFPPAIEINLVQNYRSSSAIIRVAKTSIEHNQNRSRGPLEVVKDNDELVKVFYENGRYSQAYTLVRQIQSLLNNGVKAQSIAVLYRSHYLAGALESSLIQQRINYIVFKGVRFFLRQEIKDLINSLSLFGNPRDFHMTSLLHWVKGMGTMTISKLQTAAKQRNLTLYEFLEASDLKMVNSAIRQSIRQIMTSIQELKKIMPTQDGLEEFLKQIFERLYQPFFRQNYLDLDWRMPNIVTFFEIAGNFDRQNPRLGIKEKIKQFLNETKISTDADYVEEKDSVSLMTIHNAKGLEFDHVFVFDVTNEVFPSPRARFAALEEERRLFFVALTRAKEELYIFTDITNPSLFIREIETDGAVEQKKGYF